MIRNRDDLVSLEGGGTIVGKSRPTMLVWTLNGRVRAERIDGRIFVVREDCERLARESGKGPRGIRTRAGA